MALCPSNHFSFERPKTPSDIFYAKIVIFSVFTFADIDTWGIFY